ncbi:MAG: hypothetical protein ACRDYY_11210 [Acidimicrobiales bacterium]
MSPTEPDRFAAAKAVADAVLYEGYVLYPYRASSQKNRARWQFGVLAPRAFAEADGSERWWARTECVVDAGQAVTLSIRVRCLQVQHRSVEAWQEEVGSFTPVDFLEVDGKRHVEWDEALDRVVDLPALALPPGRPVSLEHDFELASVASTESLGASGRLVRLSESVRGRVELAAAPAGAAFVKLAVTVSNTTEVAGAGRRREDLMGRSLVAVHTILGVEGGKFVSMLDPPEGAAEAVATCRSEGTFPVLIGDDDVMLSSPIILYDHPEVAPESPGDLYDATEIDEILALRVLTLTDEEKAEARGTDLRAAAVIDRCEGMPPEVWARMHGAVRSLRPAAAAPTGASWWDPDADASVDPWSDAVVVGGVEVSKGVRVRLRPSRRSDAQDLFLDGMTAAVAGVFKDVDGGDHVAVTLDGDPAAEEMQWQGRYLFFHPDEVVPLPETEVPS